MKQIDELINGMSIDNLKDCNISYNRTLNEIEVNKEIGKNYWLWKYYTGSITKEEHEECKKNRIEFDDKLLETFDLIFDESKEIPSNNSDIINCITELWIMRPRENFIHEEEYDKLIFRLYSDTHDNTLREIALAYYEKNKDKKKNDEMFARIAKDESFHIYDKDNSEYNKKYGIDNKEGLANPREGSESINNSNQNKTDWLCERFGDDNG